MLDFSTGFTVFDGEYFRRAKEYEEQLDAEQAAQWTQDVLDVFAVRDGQYANREWPVFPPLDFLAELDAESQKCYTIAIKSACIFEQTCPDSAKYAIPVNTKFVEQFNSNLASALSDFTNNFKSQTIFDSIQMEIQHKDASYGVTVLENTDHTKNIDCFSKAVS